MSDTDKPVKTNLMDVQLYFLKAALLKLGGKLVIEKSGISRIENADVKMTRRLDGSVLLEIIEGTSPESKIILPGGKSPLTII